MNILFIGQVNFLVVLFEQLFIEENIYTRSEIHDSLYLVHDLDIELLIIDVDCVDIDFWSELKGVIKDGLRIVYIGLPENFKNVSVKPDKTLFKPLVVADLKEELTHFSEGN